MLVATTLVACVASDATKKRKTPIDPSDEFGWEMDETDEQPIATAVVEDSGAYGAPERPSHKDASTVHDLDAGPPDDGGGVVTKTFCAAPLAAGDVAIVELMIASRGGSADDGEWVEIRSTKDCWLDLGGVTVESPRGASAPNVATLPAGTELAPRGSFVVAGSVDPIKNHGLPGAVFAWGATDVLKNDGDTLTVKSGGTVLDTLTYPAFSNLTPGRSLAFPSDCAAGDRADWQRWSLAFSAFSPGFQGTPNGANADVACF